MRFMMSTEEKPRDGQTFDVVQKDDAPKSEKSRKRYYIIAAVSGVVITALVLIAILVGMYIFTEAEKDILQMTMQLKNNMTQQVSNNPNTNTFQFHVKEANQETWTVNDYNADLKVMKIQTATETKCFVTPLNETAPMDLPKLKEDKGQDQPGQVSMSYTTNASPIKDTSFLSKTARDMCSGISTYWLYPTCSGPTDSNAPNTTISSNGRHKRQANLFYAICNNYFYVSNCQFLYTCTYYPPCSSFCLSQIGVCSCYNFQNWFYTYLYPYPYCYRYRCTGYYLYYGVMYFTGCFQYYA